MPTVTLEVQPEALAAVDELVNKHAGVAYAPQTPLERAEWIVDRLIADGDYDPADREELIRDYRESYEEIDEAQAGGKPLQSFDDMIAEVRSEHA